MPSCRPLTKPPPQVRPQLHRARVIRWSPNLERKVPNPTGRPPNPKPLQAHHDLTLLSNSRPLATGVQDAHENLPSLLAATACSAARKRRYCFLHCAFGHARFPTEMYSHFQHQKPPLSGRETSARLSAAPLARLPHARKPFVQRQWMTNEPAFPKPCLWAIASGRSEHK